jgi:nucleotide-binding universal stress UspA family protein
VALKDFLVHLDESEASHVRLHLAMDLASHHGSHLCALFVDQCNEEQTEIRATAERGLASAHDLAQLDWAIEADLHRAASRLRLRLDRYHAQHPLQFEWRRVRGFSDTTISKFAPYFDLCILGHPAVSKCGSAERTVSEKLVFDIPTPVMFVPVNRSFTSVGRRIVVAWDSSRTAARALNDAMPLIERSEHTTILNAASDPGRQGGGELDRLAERLRRHGAVAEALQIKISSQDIAEVLQAKALELGADLLVAGAFGHARFKERIFGGVTCSLLTHMALPILMSH